MDRRGTRRLRAMFASSSAIWGRRRVLHRRLDGGDLQRHAGLVQLAEGHLVQDERAAHARGETFVVRQGRPTAGGSNRAGSARRARGRRMPSRTVERFTANCSTSSASGFRAARPDAGAPTRCRARWRPATSRYAGVRVDARKISGALASFLTCGYIVRQSDASDNSVFEIGPQGKSITAGKSSEDRGGGRRWKPVASRAIARARRRRALWRHRRAWTACRSTSMPGEIVGLIGPKRRRQDDAVQLPFAPVRLRQRRYPVRRPLAAPHFPPRYRRARHRPDLPESRAVSHDDGARERDGGPPQPHAHGLSAQCVAHARRARGGARQRGEIGRS